MSRIERRDYKRGHAYFLDGAKVPGVTTVLGMLPKEGLVHWSALEAAKCAADLWVGLDAVGAEDIKHAAGAHRRLRDAAAARGTMLHGLVEPMLRGEQVPTPSDYVMARLAKSALGFINDWRFQPILTETTVWSEAPDYAGTLDMVGTSPLFPGRVFLADWKTSRSIHGEVALQLAAYANAQYYVDAEGQDQPMASLGITDHLAVHVTEDGYTVHALNADPEVHAYFVAALRLHGWQRTLGDRLLLGEILVAPAEVSA